jgi:HlyD family secretion protein
MTAMNSKKLIRLTLQLLPALMIFVITASCHKGEKSYIYETTPVKKGSIINTITATGTVEADTTVLIGTQVSGVINKIYVDFNSNVRKGELLAELDKTPLQTQVQQAEASLDAAKSEVEYQTATYDRYKALMDKKLIAKSDYDQVKYNYDNARANLKTAQAGYDKAKVNLSYASIFSPIAGVVLNRAVDQGQTVAASFSTPNLFTIGNDLTQMQVQANVDEADIGQVKQDQPVSFTVDAYPNENFMGSVRQIRLQPVVTSNVVTYTVIVNAPNPEKKLMPGMTANITVLVQKVDSVLTIPGKALRFTPDAAFLAEYMKNNANKQRQGAGTAGGTTGSQTGTGQPGSNQVQQGNYQGQRSGNNIDQTGAGAFQSGGQQGKKLVFVWVKNGDQIHRTRVVTGAIDGKNAEIKSGLKDGDEVILSMTLQGKAGTSTATASTTTTTTTQSPFMPTRPGGRGR